MPDRYEPPEGFPPSEQNLQQIMKQQLAQQESQNMASPIAQLILRAEDFRRKVHRIEAIAVTTADRLVGSVPRKEVAAKPVDEACGEMYLLQSAMDALSDSINALETQVCRLVESV